MRESDRVPWERNIRHGEDVNPEKAERLLFDLLDLLEKHKITYWFNWGLLLGAYRDKDFIPYDTDMDITVFWEDRKRVLDLIEPEMKKKGCYIPKVEECFPEDRWYIRDKEKIELNFVIKIGDKYVYSPSRSELACPTDYLDNLKSIEFRGRKVPIPNNVEEYLRLSYGDDWKTPIRDKKPKTL
jgi:phosphorylcholine metabolism protein LicD